MRRSSEPQPELGAAIRALRKDRGVTQEALAESANVTVSHLSAIEGGHSNPKWSTVRAIAQALGVTVAQIATRAAGLEH
jgi:transcriptional regulator with XRE-family HTH domain